MAYLAMPVPFSSSLTPGVAAIAVGVTFTLMPETINGATPFLSVGFDCVMLAVDIVHASPCTTDDISRVLNAPGRRHIFSDMPGAMSRSV